MTSSTAGRNPNSSQLIIRPTKGWAALRLMEAWEYRDLLYFMVWRDLKGRYRQTALGPLWYILQPIMSTLLYTIVFGYVAGLPSEGLPYILFNYASLLPWTLFANAIGNGSNALLGSMGLISKVYFSRLIPPLANLVSGFVDLTISFGILLLLMAWFQIVPTWKIVLLPIFGLLASMLGLGVGLCFSGLIVRFRDVGQVLGYLVRVWMYATPVVYSIQNVPQQWQWLYRLNPMVGIVEGTRWALFGQVVPDWPSLVGTSLLVLPVLLVGLFMFRRAERNIVDVA